MRPKATLLALIVCACRPDPDSFDPSESDMAPIEGELSSDLPGEAKDPAMDEPVPSSVTPASSHSDRPPDTVYRSELIRATRGGKPAYLLSQLGPEAWRPEGRFQGWRITRVFPADPELCAPGCDLHPGDVVLSVNGSPLERPEQFSALVEAVQKLEKLDVKLVRDGKLIERKFAIVSG